MTLPLANVSTFQIAIFSASWTFRAADLTKDFRLAGVPLSRKYGSKVLVPTEIRSFERAHSTKSVDSIVFM
jgi:hypothetical protein